MRRKLLSVAFLFFVAVTPIFAQKAPWPLSTPTDNQLVPNEWVLVEKYGAARRYDTALFWLPTEKNFIIGMGQIGTWNDRGPNTYDEIQFNLQERLWKNRFPAGKDWKPEVGSCDAPRVPYFKLTDGRLGLSEGWFRIWSQYAFDTDRNRLVAYVQQYLVEYDPETRQWTKIGEGDPGDGRFRLQWSSLCYDAHNKEILLFGGANGTSEFNDTRTWAFSIADKTWKRIASNDALVSAFEIKAEGLRIEAVKLHAAMFNRHFKTSLPADERVDLSQSAKELTSSIEALRKEVAGKGSGYQKTQCERAANDLQKAAALAGALDPSALPEAIRNALALTRILWDARTALMTEPPPRAHSQMVYDPKTKSIALFGGDRLDMLYADTWVYDCATRVWQERRPDVRPSPRAGHSFMYLPKSKRLALIGGYNFTSSTDYGGALYERLPMQAWDYDIAANKWELIKDWGKVYPNNGGPVRGRVTTSMAVNDQDVVLAFDMERMGDRRLATTVALQLDASARDPAKQADAAAKPDDPIWRGGAYDPDWYLEENDPDETAFQSTLAALPVNTWTLLTPKGMRLPRTNRDWGTAVLDPERQAIYRWSGGHSAHCGTDIPVFSMRTGRYHLKYPPAFPLDGVGSESSQQSRSTFMGQPWISAHTYHSYAFDPVSKDMICTGHQSFSFAYKPDSGLWTHKPQPAGMDKDNFYTLTLCTTPTGPYAWTRFGTLFSYDGKADEWSPVEVQGEALPKSVCDKASMCYDPKRDRLLIVLESLAGEIYSVDIKTKTVTKLTPKDRESVEPPLIFWRETAYDAANDLLVVPTRKKDNLWKVYDCAADAWITLDIKDNPGFAASNGLMYDSSRKLLLAVDTNSRLIGLRLDRATAEVK